MTQAPTPTADTVRRLVRSLLADSQVAGAGPDVRPVTEGGEHSTWWVGTRHVLRLAPDRETAVRRRRELRLRDLVRPLVGVAVPTSVAHGDWAGGLTYTLDTRLPGRSGEAQDVSAVGEADLAGLLTGLREVPVRQAEALGVPRAAPRSLEELRTAAERAAEGSPPPTSSTPDASPSSPSPPPASWPRRPRPPSSSTTTSRVNTWW